MEWHVFGILAIWILICLVLGTGASLLAAWAARWNRKLHRRWRDRHREQEE